MVAQGVILHINPDQIVETRCRKAQDAGHFLSMEQVGGLVPVNPHATEVVAKEVVQGIPRQKAQTVRDPVRLIAVVKKVGLDALAQVTDGLGSFLISSRPYTQSNSVKSM